MRSSTVRLCASEDGASIRWGSVDVMPCASGPDPGLQDSLQLRGPPEDYYSVLMDVAAKIAGLHKAGKMVNEESGSFRPECTIQSEVFVLVGEGRCDGA